MQESCFQVKPFFNGEFIFRAFLNKNYEQDNL